MTISGTPKTIHLPKRRNSGLSFLPIIPIFILPLLLRGWRNAHGRSRWGGMPFFMMIPFMFGGFGGVGLSHGGLVEDLVVEASLVAGSHRKGSKHKTSDLTNQAAEVIYP